MCYAFGRNKNIFKIMAAQILLCCNFNTIHYIELDALLQKTFSNFRQET